MARPTIKGYRQRLEALRSERSSFIPLYQDLSDYHLAHRGRFLTSDHNDGRKRNTKQINNTSRLSVRTLASGMMSGITSPARPWFRLSTGEKDLDDVASIKEWLFAVQNIMYRIFSASNTYNSLHVLYSELGVFGTGAMGVYHDFENVIMCRPYTVGSYMIGLNGKNVADTFYREYELSVGQCVKQFGIDNVSGHVKQQWNAGNTESWVQVVHVIEPNDDRNNISPLAKDKKIRSAYFETSNPTGNSADKFLRESGFDMFPVMVPRWDVTGEDAYATDCPGITALGDTKALQLAEKRMYQAIDKVSNPPLQGPASLKNKVSANVLKGNDILYYDKNGEGLSSLYQNYRPDLSAFQSVIDKTESRIKRAFYEDLFLMLANTDRRQITAREVAEKHEEKLLMLGPVLERLHTELLDPLINRTFDIAQDNGVFPPPPPELNNKDLDVEYVSVLAQAQRLINTGAIDRIAEFAGNMSNVWPAARNKINAEQAVDEYASALGVDPSIINSDEQVEAINAAQAAQAAQEQQMQSTEQMAAIAKQASEAGTGDNNLLGKVMQRAGIG
jgi:hypothetical protein